MFCFVLNSSQSSGREVKSHCGFICVSLMTNDIEHLFHVFLGHLPIFGEMSVFFFLFFFGSLKNWVIWEQGASLVDQQ